MSCNCYSYNWCVGETPEVILQVPKELLTIIKRDTVCLDACIVQDIKSLWEAGIATHGACCGHNKIPPPVILGDNVDQSVVEQAKYILSKPFEVYAWMDYDETQITKVGVIQ